MLLTQYSLSQCQVDLAKGHWGQNTYYRMQVWLAGCLHSECPLLDTAPTRSQVVHEKNQDNFWLFTKWGRIGDEEGQHQTTPFSTLAEAGEAFCKIFKSKSKNVWLERRSFRKHHGMYQLHELKYHEDAKARHVACCCRVLCWCDADDVAG